MAMSREVRFQEQGGPRSVSGDPTDDTVMAELKGGETLPTARCSGIGISNLWSSAN